MAINFNAIPNNKPSSLLAKGTYYATIGKAEMRTPQDDPSKPDYLSLELKLKTQDGKDCGTIYDNLTESDKNIARYKIGRFIHALGMTQAFAAAGTVNLKDLQKIASGKTVIVDIDVQEAKNGYAAKNQVDVLTDNREGYYHKDEGFAFGDSCAPAETATVAPAPIPNATHELADDIPFDETY